MYKPTGKRLIIDRLNKILSTASGIEIIGERPYKHGLIKTFSDSVTIPYDGKSNLSEGDEVLYLSTSSFPIGDEDLSIIPADNVIAAWVGEEAIPVNQSLVIEEIQVEEKTEAGLTLMASRKYRRGKILSISVSNKIEIDNDRFLQIGDEVLYEYEAGIQIADSKKLLIFQNQIIACLAK